MEIFISNLATEIDDGFLERLFSRFGPVSKAFVARDRITSKRKGYGFVSMNNVIDALRAIDEINGIMVAGNKMYVKESKIDLSH